MCNAADKHTGVFKLIDEKYRSSTIGGIKCCGRFIWRWDLIYYVFVSEVGRTKAKHFELGPILRLL